MYNDDDENNLPVEAYTDNSFSQAMTKNFIGMLNHEFSRIERFETILTAMEDRLFEPTFIATITDIDRLLKIYDFIDRKKVNKQYFTIKLIELSNKNQVLMKVISELMDADKTNKTSGTVDPKVQAIVNFVKKIGVDKIHGKD